MCTHNISSWCDEEEKAGSYKKLDKNKYWFNESGVYFVSPSLSLIVTWNEKQFGSGENPSRHTGPINISSGLEYCILKGFRFFQNI